MFLLSGSEIWVWSSRRRGAGIDDTRQAQADPINQMHADVERVLVELALSGGGTGWTFLRCTSFAAALLERGDQVRAGAVREAFGAASRTLLHERDITDIAVRDHEASFR